MGFLDTSARIRASIMEKLPTLPDNFRATLAQGVEDFAVGETFCSAETGSTRRYERIAGAPGYADMGDGAAPPTRANVVSTDAPQMLTGPQRFTARTNIGAIEQRDIPNYSSRAMVVAMTIPVAVDQFTTAGWARPGDLGNASYRRVGVEPAHPGKLQDASGAWFEQAPGEFRPQQFGGFPGNLDATVAIQSAIDAAQALLGWTRLSAGYWYAGDIRQPSNSEVFGDGKVVTIVRRRNGAALTRGVWSFPQYRTETINGVTTIKEPGRGTNIVLRDLTLDGQGNVGEKFPILSLGDIKNRISVTEVAITNGMGLWAVRGDPLTKYSYLRLKLDLTECPGGGLILLPTMKGNTWIDTSGCTFRRVGGNMHSIRDVENPADGSGRWDCNINVNTDDQTFTEPLNTGEHGPIPVEDWGCTNYTRRNFLVDGGRLGIPAGAHMTNGMIGPGKIMNQTTYAIEAGNSRNVTVRSIDAINCGSLIQWTGGHTDSFGVVWNEVRGFTMEDVTLTGTGRTNYNPADGVDVIKSEFMNHYGTRLKRITIRDPEFVRSAVRLIALAGCDITLDDTVIEARTPYSTNNGINPSGPGKIAINNPRFKRTADMPADHFLADANIFEFPVRVAGALGSVSYSNATAEMACAVTAMTKGNVAAFGSLAGNQPYNGLTIDRSRAVGNFRGAAVAVTDTSGTARIEVDTSRVTTGTVAMSAQVVDKRTKRTIEGSGAPTTGTWDIGTIVKPSVPTSGGPIEWQCIAAGTPGIWVARVGIGSDPLLTGTYTQLSTYTTSPVLKVIGSSGGTVMKFRCDAGDVNGGQPPIRLIIDWVGRKNQSSRAGQIQLAWASYSQAANAPTVKSTSIDDVAANAATVTSVLDGSGRMETTITFPVDAGFGAEVRGVARLSSYFAAYSAQLA